jgi:glycosyltransferase involved in cell wall biosynthesis
VNAVAAYPSRQLVTHEGGAARLKVLLSAYACHPQQGSEPAVGWHWLRNIARDHDIWVLTEAQRYAGPVADAVSQDPLLRSAVNVIGIPRERRAERWLGPFAYYSTYRRWQWSAFERARELHRDVRFDVAHHVNMIGYREPGDLWRLEIPFVWGPIGGYAQMPWRYLSSLGWSGGLRLGARNLANAVQMRTSCRVRAAMASAGELIAATAVDQRAIARLYGRDAQVVNETGCRSDITASIRVLRSDERLRVMWCGLMIPRKAINIALRSIAAASARIPVEFHLYGRDSRDAARKLAGRLGLDAHCVFHGQVAHEQVLAAMRQAHVLFFPSLQEATSATVPEALASGLPVLCHQVCGHGDVVDESCGVRILVQQPRNSVRLFAAALIELYENPALIGELSLGAAQRAQHFSWQLKAAVVSDIYRSLVIGRRSDEIRSGASMDRAHAT